MGTDPKQLDRRRFLTFAAAAGGLAVVGPSVLSACSLQDASADDPADANPKARFGGELVDPGLSMPDVTLTNMDGSPFPLREKAKGRLAMLLFGYTSCPDVCPVYLSTIARSIEAVGSWPDQDPMVLFVGVDVARDTPEQLKKYLGRINPTFIGLTGSEKDIAEANRQLYLPPITIGTPDANGDYVVGHSAKAMAFTPDGLAHRIYPAAETRQAQWIKDLPRLAAGQYK